MFGQVLPYVAIFLNPYSFYYGYSSNLMIVFLASRVFEMIRVFSFVHRYNKKLRFALRLNGGSRASMNGPDYSYNSGSPLTVTGALAFHF